MNTDNILELNKLMTNVRITSQQIAHDAVKGKRFIVGSFTPATGISFNATPAVHFSAHDARTECRRLAALFPGKTYILVQLIGAELSVPQPKEISI